MNNLTGNEKRIISLLKRNEEKRKKLIESVPFEDLPGELRRRIFREEKGNRCEKCGYEYTDPDTGTGPFEIHHKDKDKKNWKKENLESLCLNCHWKTGNYKFRNRHHSDKSKKLISKNNYYRQKDNL